MTKLSSILMVFALLQTTSLIAQNPLDFLPDKPGKWSYSNNITSTKAEYTAYSKVIASLAEWFHLNVPMLNSPKGYDLAATTYGGWDKYYSMNACNYGLRTELNFSFQLFLSKGGKWTVEPPHYSFDINNTETGHGTNPNFPYFDELKDNQKLEKAINDASIKMNGVFMVYPFVKKLAPGVNLYDCEAGGCGSVVVFNPERPDFWLPLTLKELADIHLEYYKIRNNSEMDRMLLKQLETEISELSADELNAPAFSGHDTHFVLKANGKAEGLQLMRFNPGYFDRSLPPWAIQFMTFYYTGYKNKREKETESVEHFKNNGYPLYRELLNEQTDWGKLAAEMIEKKE